jgi:hypothetical protein
MQPTDFPTCDEPDPALEPRLKRYRLEQVEGGFRIRTGDTDADVPEFIEVRAAYAVRHGNPFSKYQPADFDLADDNISLEPEPQGVEIQQSAMNRLVVKVIEKEFRLTVVGFDANRDLVVDVRVKTTASL